MYGGREEQVVPDSILASGKQCKHLGMPTASFPSKVERHDESNQKLDHAEAVASRAGGKESVWLQKFSTTLVLYPLKFTTAPILLQRESCIGA